MKAKLLCRVKEFVSIAPFLNSWLCPLRSVSSNDFVRSIAYRPSVSVLYGHNAYLLYLERLSQLQWLSSARFIDTWGPYAIFLVADLPGKGKGLLASRDIQLFCAWLVDVRNTKCIHSKMSDCYARNHCLLSSARVNLSNLTPKLMFAVWSSPSVSIAGLLAKLSKRTGGFL